MFVDFDHWTKGRSVASLGTNAGSAALPFQRWRHFKEAFAPEVVREAIAASPVPVLRCLDPFGGSGTTALACQFLGVSPTTIEVNPYLADLIEAKLETYDCERLVSALTTVVRRAPQLTDVAEQFLEGLPVTFVETSAKDRWIFDAPVARRLSQLLLAIEELTVESERRLFRIFLGGIMIGVSNAIVNGKGRRYRRNWSATRRTAADVDKAFIDIATSAIGEIDRYSRRRETSYSVRRGDCRTALDSNDQFDIAIFSPPYPNSFDYTDVYNIELWMLGYLRGTADNRRLREDTLSSHVQIFREFAAPPMGSPSLSNTLDALESVRDDLWSRNIPAMIGGYFADMKLVMQNVASSLVKDGQMWMVVGDSRYADVKIPVAQVLAEIAPELGLEVDRLDVLRDMRSSAQQGGKHELAESLVVVRRLG
ncbi:MAG TPA: hypothetical protein VNS79_03000 [Sphingobium sp.]|nr:hypothetical protein [Sphingobium sp.]